MTKAVSKQTSSRIVSVPTKAHKLSTPYHEGNPSTVEVVSLRVKSRPIADVSRPALVGESLEPRHGSAEAVGTTQEHSSSTFPPSTSQAPDRSDSDIPLCSPLPPQLHDATSDAASTSQIIRGGAVRIRIFRLIRWFSKPSRVSSNNEPGTRMSKAKFPIPAIPRKSKAPPDLSPGGASISDLTETATPASPSSSRRYRSSNRHSEHRVSLCTRLWLPFSHLPYGQPLAQQTQTVHSVPDHRGMHSGSQQQKS